MVAALASPPSNAGEANAAAAALPAPPMEARHPPYKEMILQAVSTLSDRKGASRSAIGRYISNNFSGFSARHRALLAHHLRRLCRKGSLIVQSLRYFLPVSAAKGPANVVARPRGRPPKSGVHGIARRKPGRPRKVSVPLPLSLNQNTGAPGAIVSEKRKPGRPSKAVSAAQSIVMLSGELKPQMKQLQVHLPSAAAQTVEKRKPGRPPKAKFSVQGAVTSNEKRKRGRPPKPKASNSVSTLVKYAGESAKSVISEEASSSGKRKREPPQKYADAYSPDSKKSNTGQPHISANTNSASIPVEKRRPGRPPKNPRPALPISNPDKLPVATSGSILGSGKRKPGRPRKNPDVSIAIQRENGGLTPNDTGPQKHDDVGTASQSKNAGLARNGSANTSSLRENSNSTQPSEDEVSAVTPSGKRRPGRPPKMAGAITASLQERKRGRPPKNIVSIISALKRKPGRPPKNIDANAMSTSVRKPGRPPKNIHAVMSAVRRKPGRPPKNVDAVMSAVRRKPGRPPNNAAIVVSSTEKDTTENATVSVPSTEQNPHEKALIDVPSTEQNPPENAAAVVSTGHDQSAAIQTSSPIIPSGEKRGRGRPRKIPLPTPSDSLTKKRKPGRPPKILMATSAREGNAATAASTENKSFSKGTSACEGDPASTRQ